MKEIEQFATQFRRAIDLALEAGEFDNDSIYRRFPRACCGDTSDLLAQYLLDKGIKLPCFQSQIQNLKSCCRLYRIFRLK